MIHFDHSYEDIISMENLLGAWREFVKGKRSRLDVQEFEFQLMPNLIILHERLEKMTYRHSSYDGFVILDPKKRIVHKATVADRVVHRAIYRKLYPFFERTFIADSFSCRLGKGTHRALDRFLFQARKSSRNHRKTVWVLKCDIRRFFASINHEILLRVLEGYVLDKRIVWFLERVVCSFSSGAPGVGLPLGNLTSQLFANVYLNVFDQYVKHRLHVKQYIRYADDFVIFSRDRKYLGSVQARMADFLRDELQLQFHPDKVEIRAVASGVDFLGWVHFPDFRVLRTTTKRRMIKVVSQTVAKEVVASYLGLLRHGNTFGLRSEISGVTEKRTSDQTAEG